jgi:hypothetical protein
MMFGMKWLKVSGKKTKKLLNKAYKKLLLNLTIWLNLLEKEAQLSNTLLLSISYWQKDHTMLNSYSQNNTKTGNS